MQNSFICKQCYLTHYVLNSFRKEILKVKKIHGIDELNTVIQKTDNNHKWGRNKNLYVCIDIFSSLDIDAKKTITKMK